MRNKPGILVLILFSCVLFTIIKETEAVGGYLGCFKETKRERHFGVSPGGYDPNDLTIEACIGLCGSTATKYEYAGVTQGSYCFCAETDPGVYDADAYCDTQCSGSTDTCGGFRFVSAYKVPVSVRGLVLAAVGDGIAEISSGSIGLSIALYQGPNDMEYSFDYGDNSGVTTRNATGMEQKIYSVPGEYTTTVIAQDASNILQEQRRSVKVLAQAPAGGVTLLCPALMATDEPFTCNATIDSGSTMDANIDFEDGTVQSFPIADATWFSAGPGIPSHTTVGISDTSEAGKLYIMPNSMFTMEGTLQYFEYHGASPGNVDVFVLRPDCGANFYCFEDNTCHTSDCGSGLKCSDTAFGTASYDEYCPVADTCADSSSLTSCYARPSKYLSPPNSYSVIFKHTLTVAMGRNLENVIIDGVAIQPGDVLGCHYASTGKLSTRALNGDVEDMQQIIASPGSSATGISVGTGGFGARHLLKGIATSHARVLFFHEYATPGLYDVFLNVSTTLIDSFATDMFTMEVVVGINHAIIECEEFATIGTAHLFDVAPHTGSNVTYIWDFGDGSALVTTDQMSITHTYTTRGHYNVSLRAENSLTFKENVTTITTEHAITGLVLAADPAPVGEPHGHLLTMTSGSDYICDWAIDESTPVNWSTDETVTPITGVPTLHTYSTPGGYNVDVSCSNNVSGPVTATQAVTAQHRITNVQLKQTATLANSGFEVEWTFDTGTDPNFDMKFDGTLQASSSVSSLEWKTGTLGGVAVGLYDVEIHSYNLVSNFTDTFNFTVEKELTDAKAIIKDGQDVITQYETVTFQLTASGGSSVNIIIDPGDGTTPFNDFLGALVEWDSSTPYEYTHTYNTGGVFTALVTMQNSFMASPPNGFPTPLPVKVYAKIENITFETNAPVAYLDGKGDVEFWFDAQSDFPDTTVAFDFVGDGVYGPAEPLNTNGHKYTHSWDTPIVNQVITAKLKNDGAEGYLTAYVDVIVPVANLDIYVDPPHAVVNSIVKVGITMEKGNAVTLYWNWDYPGDWDVSRPKDESLNSYQPDWSQTTYSTVGMTTIAIMASNVLGNTTKLYDMYSQYGVNPAEFTFTSNAPLVYDTTGTNTVTYTLEFTGTAFPTDAYYYVDNGDGTPVGEPVLLTQADLPMSIPITYNGPGDFLATLNISNLASSAIFKESGSVLEPVTVTGGSLKIKPAIPVDAPLVSGDGPGQNTFAQTDEVYFVMDTTGTVERYEVEIVDATGSVIQVCNKTENPFAVNFDQAGTFNIEVTAINALGEASYSFTGVSVLDKITNVVISDDNEPVEKNVPKTMSVDFGTMADDGCVLIDYGDGTKECFSNSSTSCQSIHGVSTTGSLTDPLPLTHTYTKEGAYTVELIAGNDLWSVTSSHSFVISGVDCSRPILSIAEQRVDFRAPLEMKKSEHFTIEGITKLECAVSLDNKKTWRTEKVDASSGAILGTESMVGLATGANAALYVPARFLEFGLYRFTYNVTMDSTANGAPFTEEVSTYIKIVAADLIALMESGGMTRISVGYNTNVILDPAKFSIDPSQVDPAQPVDTREQSTFDGFYWACKEYNEKFVDGDVADVDVEDIPYPGAGSSHTFSTGSMNDINAIDDKGGCARQGPGRMSYTDGKIEFNTRNMHENETYEFVVDVVKGTLRSRATLLVDVLPGNPATSSIGCMITGVCTAITGGILVSPTEQLALEGVCRANCDETLSYKWQLYRIGLNNQFIEWEDFSQYVSGTNSRTIGIKPTLFEAGFEMWDQLNTYKIKLSVSKEGETTGVATTIVKLNKTPYGGNCTISPKSGLVLTTDFTINCFDWKDDSDGIGEYQVFGKFKDLQMEQQIYAGKNPSIPTNLMEGPYWDSYQYDVFVRVYDGRGAQTTFFIDRVEVRPIPHKELDSLLDDYIRGDETILDKKVAEADPKELCTFCQGMLSAIDASSEYWTDENGRNISCQNIVIPKHSVTTGFTPKYQQESDKQADNIYEPTSDTEKQALIEICEKQRNERAQLREEIGVAVSKLTTGSVSTLQQVASTMAMVTEEIDETSRDTQVALSESLLNMTKLLSKWSTTVQKDEVEVAAVAIFETIGNIMESSLLTKDNGLIIDKERAKQTKFYLYESDWESKRARMVGGSRADQENALTTETNSIVQTDVMGNQIAKSIDEATKILTQILMNTMVPGDDPVEITTGKMLLTLNKDEANAVTNQTITQGKSEIKIPKFCDMTNEGSSCDDSQIVTSSIIVKPYNPDFYLSNGNLTNQLSSTLTMNFYDEAGNEIQITDMKEPIEFTLHRDETYEIQNTTFVPDAEIPKDSDEYLFWHSFENYSPGSSIHVFVKPDDPDVQFLVLVRFDEFPHLNGSKRGWDYLAQTPRREFELNQREESYPDEKYTILIDNTVVNSTNGRMIIGLRQLNASEKNLYTNDNPPGIPAPDTGGFTCTYEIKTYLSGCYFYNDESTALGHEGCRVVDTTNETMTTCSCTHLTSFTSAMYVAPNKIDWDFVFSNADFFKNPTLYITLIIVAVIYFVVVIWARRQDKKDAIVVGCTPLADNDPKDRYLYEVITKTGSRKNAATDSNVQFILSGEFDETDVRVFSDSERKIFRRGKEDSFLMAVPRPLGPIQYARVWHDNSGRGKFQGWYLHYMMVRDLQTLEKFIFVVNKWFAVEESDGQVDRLIPIAGREQMAEFSNMFSQHTRKNLSDDHLWFSIVARPPASRFSRVQRVSCCLCLLLTSMLANAMFYEREKEGAGAGAFTFGPFSLTPQQLYIGLISNIIVFPVNFIVVFLFRRSKARKPKKNRLREAIEKNESMMSQKQPRSPSDSTDDMRNLMDSPRSSPDITFGDTPSPQRRPYTPPAPPQEERGLEDVTVQNNDDDNKDKKKKKKKPFQLPWFFMVISWILLWGATLTSAAFVVFYGIMFEDIKCKKWITSMLVSFVTSIFLTQPIKVFATAIFFSLIFKNDDITEEVRETEEEFVLKQDERWLHAMPGEPGYGAARPRKIAYKPPDPQTLEEARKNRMNELKMYDVLREILFYSMFLWLLLVISYEFRSPSAFFMKQGLDNLIVDQGLGKNKDISIPERDFRKVVTRAHFFNWMKDILAPSLRAAEWYNGEQPFGQRGMIGDRYGRIMGFATARQLRVQPGKCGVLSELSKTIMECNVEYSIFDEETKNFGVGWVPYNASATLGYNNSKAEFIYRTGDEIDSMPFWGTHAFYSGGGYMAELRGNRRDVVEKVDQLMEDFWIDKYTRAVFVEFTVYNANVNLFGIMTFVAEFLNSGGVQTHFRIEPMNLLGDFGTFSFGTACQIAYVLFILFFIIKEMRNVYKQGKNYFKQFWNWIEVSVIILSITGIVIYFYRYTIAFKLVERFHETHGNEYMKFQYCGYWNELLMYLVGWLCFLATIKFIRLLRFNKRMGMLASTLRVGAKPLALFGVMFGIMFMAFVQFFYLIYFNELINFKTIVHSAETLLQMLVGKFNFNAMQSANPYLGPFVFFCYVITVYYILINMFLTILNESFASVRADIALQSNEYEIVEFILRRFKQWSGLANLSAKVKEDEETLKGKTSGPGYEQNFDDFPEKVDRLLDVIGKVYFEADRFDAIFDSSGNGQGGKNAMREMRKGQKGGNRRANKQEMAEMEQAQRQLGMI